MSNNCLITKLRGIVSDDTLEKLGVIKVDVAATSNESFLISKIQYSKDVVLKGIGGQFVQPYNQSVVLGTEYAIDANDFSYFETLLNTAMEVDLPEKYSIVKIEAGNRHKIKAEDLRFSSGLISIAGMGIGGDISQLGELQNLASIVFNYSVIAIDANIFADANTFVGLQTLTLTNCPNVTNKTNAVKALIEAAHPGITVTW